MFLIYIEINDKYNDKKEKTRILFCFQLNIVVNLEICCYFICMCV